MKDDETIGVAKRDIKAGETITVVITGNRTISPDLKLNKNGKKFFRDALLKI